MITVRINLLVTLVLSVAALGLGACGSSDEEQIRSAVRDLGQAFDNNNADRVCGLLGPRAEAQYSALLSSFTGTSGCRALVKQIERDDSDRLSAKQIDSAKVAIRGDLATFAAKGDHEPLGLRKIHGEWRIDNILDPSLHERVRGEVRLTRGTAEQQIRATMAAAYDAVKRDNFARFCRLMSDGAEASVLLAGAFTSISDAENGSALSCAAALRSVSSLADKDVEGGLAAVLPSPAALKTARVSIRASRATVEVRGQPPTTLVRVDGRWLFDAEADQQLTPADYKRCWRAAGATIASQARDLRFIDADSARHIAETFDRVSVKGGNWRIFYTLPKGGDPGLDKVLEDPGSVSVVAYVRDAAAHPRVVTEARACGD